jgi:hypothetical protein
VVPESVRYEAIAVGGAEVQTVWSFGGAEVLYL